MDCEKKEKARRRGDYAILTIKKEESKESIQDDTGVLEFSLRFPPKTEEEKRGRESTILRHESLCVPSLRRERERRTKQGGKGLEEAPWPGAVFDVADKSSSCSHRREKAQVDSVPALVDEQAN